MPIVDPLRSDQGDASLDAEITELKSLPDKYKDKSREELAKMHMEAEKVLSRQGQTVGEQRKIIDQFVQLQLSEKSAEKAVERTPLTASELFDDPDKALAKTIRQSEVGTKVEQLEQSLTNLKIKQAQEEFERKHDGKVRDILSDTDFQSWVQASPHRLNMVKKLDNYDFSAGDDLLSLWKDYQEFNDLKSKREEAQTKRQQNLRAARTEGGSAGGEITPKTIFSRVEIGQLMTKSKAGDKDARAKFNNPEFQAQLKQAYIDGRVR